MTNQDQQPITNQPTQYTEGKAQLASTQQIVTFDLAGEEYATEITELKEIIKLPEIVPVPGSQAFIQGIFNLRGQVVVVVDLEKKFQLSSTIADRQPKHVIIVEIGQAFLGVKVDEVTGVLRVPLYNIKPTPPAIVNKAQADYLKGVIVLSDTEQQNSDLNHETIKKQGKNTENTEKTADSSRKTKPSIVRGEKGSEEQKKQASKEEGSRLLLYLDLPKVLTQEELKVVATTAEKVNLKSNNKVE